MLKIILIGLILFACTPRIPSRFVSTTDPDLLAACEHAADRWFAASGVAIECALGDLEGYTQLEWGNPSDACAAGSTSRTRVRVRPGPALECDRGGPVTDPRWPHSWPPSDGHTAIMTIVAHEFGHVIVGSPSDLAQFVGSTVGRPWHGHAAGGLMARVAGVGARIDAETLDWLCARTECLWEVPE